MFTVPDKGEGQSDFQSNFWQAYLDILMAGLAGSEFVLSGGAVTAQGAPNMTVAVAKAATMSGGALLATAAGTGTITTADATNPRLDLVVITSAGAIAVRAGTPAALPRPPDKTAGDVVLAVVYVPANDTTISSDQIVDMRIERKTGPIVVGKKTSATTINTSTAKTAMYSIVLPSGLLLSGKQLRGELGGTYLANSGTGTWTWTIDYGGTTLFADATAATVAGAARGAWRIGFVLNASANAVQQLVGVVNFQTPAAKTAPTTGVGDLAVVTHVAAPINGAGTIDSDAADRTLTISVTHSVSNVAVETVCNYALVEFVP